MTTRTFDWWRAHLDGIKEQGDGSIKAVCPSHDDPTGSLHVGPGTRRDGTPLIDCFAGCAFADIVAAASAHTNGTGPKVTVVADGSSEDVQDPSDHAHPRAWLVAKTGATPEFLKTLPITFRDGWILHHFDPLPVTKDRQAGTKARRWSPTGVHHPPIWPLPTVMAEVGTFPEGESDGIALRGIGMPDVYAITGGAKNLPSVEQWRWMHKLGLRHARLAFDADEAGRKATKQAIGDAFAAGLAVSSVTPPDYNPLTGTGKDWCDWVAAGGTLDTFPEPASTEVTKTVADMLDAPPTQWRHRGYEAIGGVHMVYGRPKVGKSRTEYARAAAYERGDAFFGVQVEDTASTYFMTEEGASTIREKVEAHHLERAEFLMFADSKAQGWGFSEALAFVVGQCHKHGHSRLVIDTILTWLEVEDINDSKEMLDALNEVRNACVGLTSVLIYHARKQGGEDGIDILGATGILASLDVAIGIDRDDKQRNIRVVSRYIEVPEPIATELIDGEITVVGIPRIKVTRVTGDKQKRQDAIRSLLAAIPRSAAELVTALAKDGIAASINTVKSDVSEIGAEAVAAPGRAHTLIYHLPVAK